jgi:hypothetical protein
MARSGILQSKPAVVVSILLMCFCRHIESKASGRALRLRGATSSVLSRRTSHIERRTAVGEIYGARIGVRPASDENEINKENQQQPGEARLVYAEVSRPTTDPVVQAEEFDSIDHQFTSSSPQESSKASGKSSGANKQSSDNSKDMNYKVSSKVSQKSQKQSSVSTEKKRVSLENFHTARDTNQDALASPTTTTHQDVVDETEKVDHREGDEKFQNRPPAQDEENENSE